MNFLTNGCVVLSNKYADSGLITVILSAVPVFITIIDCIILKNYKLGKLGWIGIFGGILGIIFIVLCENSGIQGSFIGIMFAVCATLFWSIGSIYSRKFNITGSPVAHIAIEALFSSFLFMTVGTTVGDFVLKDITFKSLLPVIYLAIVDSLIGFLSYTCLLKIWKPSVVSTYAYINPIVALILGAIILNESLTAGKIVGMIIIILSVILIQKDKIISNT